MTDYRVAFLSKMYQTAKGIIDRTILTCLNQQKELSVTYGRIDPNYRKASL